MEEWIEALMAPMIELAKPGGGGPGGPGPVGAGSNVIAMGTIGGGGDDDDDDEE